MKSTGSNIHKIKTNLLNEISSLSRESIIVCDHDKNIIKVNRAFTSITGYQQDEVVGVSINSLSSDNHNINFHETIWYKVKNNGAWQGEVWSQRKSGDTYPEWRSVSAIYNNQGNVDCYIAISVDLSEKKGFQDRIHQLVHYDQLTKLPNKSLLMQLLTREITKSQEQNKQLAVLFLDLDGFKRINDSMGHQTGDNLLNIIAQRLRHCVRNKDIVSRWGSDDFVIVLPDITPPDDVAVILKNIHYYLLEPISLLEQKQLVVSTSVGISIYPSDGNNSVTLLQNASIAMNNAKNNGGNCYKFYTTKMNVSVIEHLSIETDLRAALGLD